MSFPQVELPDDDRLAQIRAQFQTIVSEDDFPTDFPEVDEQAAPKRKRGRPPGSKNKPKPADYAPIRSDDSELPTLATPPLSTRDQREVAKRLAGILTGVTGVASVVKPYMQMTDEEAEAIATPLSTYLIRQETTSGVAKQILEEYDVAAFAIALAAYVVRVFLDYKAERDQLAERAEQPINVTDSIAAEQRESIGTVGSTVSESSLQSQEGTERPVSRQLATASEGSWSPSPI